MNLQVAVSGWLLGPPSGANRRLLGILGALEAVLGEGEGVTVLHGPGFVPPRRSDRITWRPVSIPARPTWRRVLAERRLLAEVLTGLGAQVLDHGLLPAPRVAARLCLTIHDLRSVDGEDRRWAWLSRAVLRRSAGRAQAIVVPSRFTAERVGAHVPGPPPIHVIPNVADLPDSAPPADAGSYYLHVGHLEPRKNLSLLLRAFARLPTELRRARELRLVGADAGEGTRLRGLCDGLGITDRVRFLGVLPDSDLPPLYAGAAAVCVPSRYEGFGLCAAEGLRAGVPVLVADRGALPEITGGSAMVLPADDVGAWAAALTAPGRNRAATPPGDDNPWLAPAATLASTWRGLAAGPRPHRT